MVSNIIKDVLPFYVSQQIYHQLIARFGMGKLSRATINNYICKVRKLRKVLPLLADSDPRKAQVAAQVERLTNQLGLEMNDLEITLNRGPGRPREIADVSDVVVPVEKPPVVFTPDALEERFKALQKRKREVELAQGEVSQADIERSNDELAQMLKEGDDERSKQDADDAKAVGGTTRSV